MLSISEVTNLRKAGRLSEALSLAEKLIEQECNEWTSNALFWVLREYVENEYLPNKQLDQAEDCLNKMGELLPIMRDESGAGEKTYHRLLEQLDPEKAYNEMVAQFGQQAQNLEPSHHENFGWVLYRYLKACVGKLTSVQVRTLLRDYMQLANERPSKLHSAMLRFALKFSKEHQDFNVCNYVRMWSGNESANFRSEDWEADTGKDGSEYRSLAAKAAKACFDGVKADAQKRNDRQLLEWLKQLHSDVVKRNAGDDWNLRGYATICAWLGDVESAIGIYRKLLLCMPDKYYLWTEMANLVSGNNEVRIGLLLMAKRKEKHEKLLGPTHFELAQVCADEGFVAIAKNELSAYATSCAENGGRVKDQYRTLVAKVGSAPESGTQLDVQQCISAANDYIYADLPVKYGVVDYVNEAKQTLHIVTQNSKYVFVKHKKNDMPKDSFVKFREYEHAGKDGKPQASLVCVERCARDEALPSFPGCIAVVSKVDELKKQFYVVPGLWKENVNVSFQQTNIRPATGDFVRITYCLNTNREGKQYMKLLDVKPSEQENMALMRTVTGRLKVHYRDGYAVGGGPDFAFVGDCYVHRDLLRQHHITTDCQVTARAVPSHAGKWQAFALQVTQQE